MYTYSLFTILKNRKLSISRLEASLTIKEGGGGKDCEKKRANEDCLERVFGRGSISDRRFITTSRWTMIGSSRREDIIVGGARIKRISSGMATIES